MRISDWSSDVCSSDLPQITIPASGFRKCRIQRPYRRPHSITCTLDQKLLAPRAATTEDASSNWTLWAKTRSASIAAIALSTNFSEGRSEEHTSETPVTNANIVCRLLFEKKKTHN